MFTVRFWNTADENIAEDCAAEGYPSHGSNYDLRVADLREYYPELFGEEEE